MMWFDVCSSLYHGAPALSWGAATRVAMGESMVRFRLAVSGLGAVLFMGGAMNQAGVAQAGAQPGIVPSTVEQPDKYQWLEDVSGERSMTWVKAENERTAKVLEADPRFAALNDAALKVAESPERLAYPSLVDGMVYNTWQDAEHVKGIYRKTTLADYLTEKPTWKTVIDYDALAKQDKQEWVAHGLNCLYPGNTLCLVALSAGGEDADTLREAGIPASSHQSQRENLRLGQRTHALY